MTQNKISKYFNPWHHVSYGDNIPQFVNTIIEIPEGSKAKYELDKKSGLLKLDRVLFSAVHYPANYGFIPRTLSDDEDPLDILVICSVEVDPLCLIEAKVIGVMEMVDNEEKDEKIISYSFHLSPSFHPYPMNPAGNYGQNSRTNGLVAESLA